MGAGEWQLVAQHPAGSLDVAVAKWRRRNLLISFGLLAILAESMVLIFSLARRTERLARLQMEFVAGVSHELCTPLAVINSAAENLNDGVVEDAAGIRRYGGMIRDQGRRLERLVEQVLLFAAGRFGASTYELCPVQPAVAIEQSLAASEPLLREAGFTVEKQIEAGLPLVMADPAAITKCVENLLSNAVKYSNASHWVGVRARAAPEGPTHGVQIIVEDHGLGIAAADISHIFEPFYRVQGVRENQTRGVGLGLYLVKQMMEGMGGHVSVSSEPARGSSFVLHFASCAPAKEEPGSRS
jgi:signal transduction histidine kinase